MIKVKDQDEVHDKAMEDYAKKRGIENLDDRVLLSKEIYVLLSKEIYPSLAKQPFYKGDGMHGVTELQDLCKQFKEYCHQQALIKQELLLRLGWID